MGGAGGGCYELYGVVEHSGSFKTGHYVAYVRRECAAEGAEAAAGSAEGSEGSEASWRWYRMDDSKVSVVDVGTVLAAKAFLLYYEKHMSSEA